MSLEQAVNVRLISTQLQNLKENESVQFQLPVFLYHQGIFYPHAAIALRFAKVLEPHERMEDVFTIQAQDTQGLAEAEKMIVVVTRRPKQS